MTRAAVTVAYEPHWGTALPPGRPPIFPASAIPLLLAQMLCTHAHTPQPHHFQDAPGFPGCTVFHGPPLPKQTPLAPNTASSGLLPVRNTIALTTSRDQSWAPPPAWGRRGSGGLAGGTPCTFINEAHILLVGRGEDLAAVGGRAGATVPLAVVDDSGDRGTGGVRPVRRGWGQAPPTWRPLHCPRPTWSSLGRLVLALRCRIPSASGREAHDTGMGWRPPSPEGLQRLEGRGVHLPLPLSCGLPAFQETGSSHNPAG